MAEKQHYVPVAYLKHFTNLKGRFYSVDLFAPYYKSPFEKHPNKVCYELDMYEPVRGEFQEGEIEKKSFGYENKQIKKIHDIFDSNNFFIPKTQYKNFISLYLSLKNRNKYMRMTYQNASFHDFINQEISVLANFKGFIEKESGENFEEVTERIKNKIIEDEKLPIMFHNQSIKEQGLGGHKTINEVTKKLYEMRVLVFEPKSSTDFFITSDNPGFTVVDDKQIFNTHFAKFDAVGYPVNPRKFVLIIGKDDFHPLDIQRRLVRRKIDTTLVNVLNHSTAFVASKYIFCPDFNYLHKFSQEFRNTYPHKIQSRP